MTNIDASMTSILPLDNELCVLNPDEVAFLLAETRIDTEDALKKHLLDIQAKAYKVYPYPCIKRFSFAKFKISRMPAYQTVLKLGREREHAIFVDIGCCFGEGIRKIVADGFPINRVVGFDIEKDYWDLGHETFRSTPETFPVPFIKGDIFDPSILKLAPPSYDAPKTPRPILSSLTSLNPLRGHASALYVASFFHLFNEERQLRLARVLAGLLSFEPGSIIFGSHVGNSVKGLCESSYGTMFCHSPDSWKQLWDGEVFEKGKVKVEALLKAAPEAQPELKGPFDQGKLLVWTVTRL